MDQKIKVLIVERKHEEGYWIAGTFLSDEAVAQYVDLYLFEEDEYEVEEFPLILPVKPLQNGEYAYQVLVQNQNEFLIEAILDPDEYTGPSLNAKLPLRIQISARNAEQAREKSRILLKTRNQR
ncbi:hypothetical protein D9M68_460520 [compost metagenome]